VLKLLQYYLRFQNARGSLSRLPGWAKIVLLIVALPGICGILLSVLVFCVSLIALLILTSPVYRLLNWMSGGGREVQEEFSVEREPTEFIDAETIESATESPVTTTFVTPASPEPQRPKRQIDVKIIE
jgi:hypothetical protein